MPRLGPNAYGEHLRPGRVTDCYLGILLELPLAKFAPEPGRVLVVAPAVLLNASREFVPHVRERLARWSGSGGDPQAAAAPPRKHLDREIPQPEGQVLYDLLTV